jgi:hypothetical protein
MSKRGKPGRHRWIISDWLADGDGAEFWLTLIAVVGWILLIIIVILNPV